MTQRFLDGCKIIKLTSFFVLIGLQVAASPKNEPEKYVREAQAAAALRAQTFNKFEQENFVFKTKKIKKSSGTLQSSVPNKFRWETISPSKEIFVSNGSDFWKYIEINKHAQKLSASAMDLDFLNVLFDLGQLTIRYHLATWDTKNVKVGPGTWPQKTASNDHVLLALTPKSEGEPKSYLALDRKLGLIQEMRIAYDNGNVTRIVFSDYNGNKVPSDFYNFTPPSGTVVDEAPKASSQKPI